MPELADELRGLFARVTEARVPDALALHSYFVTRGLSIKPAGPNLERPIWSTFVAPEDSFVDLGKAVAGIRFADDPRGYGAYVEFCVTTATLDEVEEVTGPLVSAVSRLTQYEVRFARAVVLGHRIAVHVVHDKGAVKSVTVQFDRN